MAAVDARFGGAPGSQAVGAGMMQQSRSRGHGVGRESEGPVAVDAGNGARTRSGAGTDIVSGGRCSGASC